MAGGKMKVGDKVISSDHKYGRSSYKLGKIVRETNTQWVVEFSSFIGKYRKANLRLVGEDAWSTYTSIQPLEGKIIEEYNDWVYHNKRKDMWYKITNSKLPNLTLGEMEEFWNKCQESLAEQKVTDTN